MKKRDSLFNSEAKKKGFRSNSMKIPLLRKKSLREEGLTEVLKKEEPTAEEFQRVTDSLHEHLSQSKKLSRTELSQMVGFDDMRKTRLRFVVLFFTCLVMCAK